MSRHSATASDAGRARELIARARRVTVLTGAGVSAESGVPTFRGAGGLWRTHRAEELATPQAFRADPRLVWEFYQHRRATVAPLLPNAAHRALVQLEERLGDGFRLVTQNVDGLHAAAGSRRMVCIHGSLWRVRCTGCGAESEDRRPDLVGPGPLPACGACGALLRPAVVWFGEALDPACWAEAERAARECDLLLVAGTSAVVYPAAGLVPLARASGARAVEVNLEPTPLSDTVDVSLQGQAAEILPELVP